MNSVDEEIYVGCTTQTLAQRMGKHRRTARNRNTKFYRHMNYIGTNNFYIELICKYPCENVEELHAKAECFRTKATSIL